jgi:YbbR domain-containing protein
VSARNAARAVWPRRIDLRHIVTHDFPLKAAAVVIAILFWVGFLQNAAPREITVTFDGRVPIERPDAPAGFVLRGQLGDVAVKLSGPEGVVNRVALADLRATVDIAGLEASQTAPRDAKVLVTVLTEGVHVIDIAPATIAVRLERITSRTVVVQTKLANDPPKGSQAGLTSVSPKEVRVSGPDSAVAQIAAVFATVRFGDVATNISDSAPAIPVDANGLPIDGLQVEPGVVVVNVPLLPTATTKTVPVLWTLKGAVANGYWISNVSTDPVAVTVSGDQGVISQVVRIETAAVDVTGLSANRSTPVALLLPEGVELVRKTDASVTVTVVPLAGTRPFFTAVQILNLLPGLDATADPGSVTATVAGPAPELSTLTSAQVIASADASGRGPGTYTLDVAVRTPSGITLQTVQPLRVTVTIKSR